jgi:hydroxypyruvate isomerase
MEMAAVCAKFIPLTDPSQREAYLAGLEETVAACEELSCSTIISQVGNEIAGVPRESQKQSIIDGLKAAAAKLAGTGITLVIEPLNLLVDHAGYFLARSDEAAEIIEAVDSPHIRMLFDIYHQQITEGNLINNIKKHFKLIGHFHIADNPGRKEPGTGEINYANVIDAINELGFEGHAGTEFFPSTDSEKVLEKFAKTYIN